MDQTEENKNTAGQQHTDNEAENNKSQTQNSDGQIVTEGEAYDEIENPELFEGTGNSTETGAGDAEENETLLTAEQKLEKQVDKLTKELTESNDKYLRMVAEFDNFRKRTSKERMDLFKSAGKDVLVSIIPVMDDFERAEKAIATATDIKAVKDGLAIVSGKLKGILNQQGLKEMISIGQAFDTDMHEAITSIPAPTPAMKGKVIDEVERGYLLNDKVIRFAKVIIAE